MKYIRKAKIKLLYKLLHSITGVDHPAKITVKNGQFFMEDGYWIGTIDCTYDNTTPITITDTYLIAPPKYDR